MSDPAGSADEDVVHAVRRALANHGYARLTTKKVAAESDKSEAGLYYHYDSKDEMVAAFLEWSTGWLAADLDDLDATDPESRLREACDRLFVTTDGSTGFYLALGLDEFEPLLRDGLSAYIDSLLVDDA